MERIIVPVDDPLFVGMSSYYLDTHKLIEHFKENNFTGCFHFKAHQFEGAMYFDSDELLSSIVTSSDGTFLGDEALDQFHETSQEGNLTINVYKISPEKLYYWANLLSAHTIYRDLKAEFTDLEGLINKMVAEDLTGYITVSLGDGTEGGVVLFQNGEILQQICQWDATNYSCSLGGPDELINKSREKGGTFHVKKVDLKKGATSNNQKLIKDTLIMLQEVLSVAENTIHSVKKYRGQFDTILKKKFLEKTETYPCLDPFTNELIYFDGTLEYTGKDSAKDLTTGVLEATAELIQEIDLEKPFLKNIKGWQKRYAKKLSRAGVSFYL